MFLIRFVAVAFSYLFYIDIYMINDYFYLSLHFFKNRIQYINPLNRLIFPTNNEI